MQPTAQPSVGLDRRARRLAVAASGTVLAVAFVLAMAGIATALLAVLPALFLATILPRGSVSRIDVSADRITLETAGGFRRRLPRADVASAWIVGSPRYGRTAPLAGRTGPFLVLADIQGRILSAPRLTWLSAEQIALALTTAGVSFHGFAPPFHPSQLAPARWPTDVPPPPPGPGANDGITASVVLRLQRRATIRATLGWVLVVAMPLLAGSLHANKHDQPLYGITWALEFGVLGVVFGVLFVGAVRSRAWRAARITRTQPWHAVEAIVLGGFGLDPGKRTVLIIDATTQAPVLAFGVEEGGERGWLQPAVREWFLVSIDPSQRQAVLAPPDRHAFALLAARDLGKVMQSLQWQGLG